MKAAFTLLETLVVFTVIAVLVAIAIPATTKISSYAARVKSVSNLRQIGVASRLYASDHNQQIPGRTAGSDPLLPSTTGLWPQQFCEYLSPSDPRVFLDPTDPLTAKLPLQDVLSTETNNTGYIYNGFDDLAAGNQPLLTVPLTRLDNPTQVVLLAQKTQGVKDFYADPLLGTLGALLALLNPSAYDGGAHYLFVDGSVRFIKQSEYSNSFWLVDKTIPLPPLPGSNDHPSLICGAPGF